MKYFERFLKIILAILKFFCRILATMGFGLMMFIQIIVGIQILFVITIAVLLPIEFFIIRPIYFIATGDKLLDKCYGCFTMFEDFVEMRNVRIKRRENESEYEHFKMRENFKCTFYDDLWEKICNIKIEIK